MNSSGIEPGELVVADILFAEQVGAKRRLALVISNAAYNQSSPDVVVLKVTSSGGHTAYDIPLTNDHTRNKSLKKESTIMTDFPAVIVKENIVARPDRIIPEKMQATRQKLRQLYEL
ncbi:MAG: type II toxin-antitoxin system PemK/MazF family toxin [Candidatus Diapherotrites archaeon]|nr:type II toxin-antitoxin system PemK/MazF family toxin [Candidatus Diapherotrites archaeon]